jgi:hypothetical protein
MVGVALSPRIAEAVPPLPWRALAVGDQPDLDALLDELFRTSAQIVEEAFRPSHRECGSGPAIVSR